MVPDPRRRPRFADASWIVLWLLVSGAWLVSVGPRLSATFDEPTYVANGLEGWRAGTSDALMRLGTMPLPVDAITLPLFLAEKYHGVPFRVSADRRGSVIDLTDLPALLPFARAAMLPFWALLMLASWRIAFELGGRPAAYLAVALVALEPTLLAHAALATTDVPFTACVIAFGAAYSGGREQGWRRRVAIPGLWFGLALLSKASALVFCPAVMAGVEWARPAAAGRWRTLWREVWQIGAIGLAFALVYCGSGWHRQESFVEWAASRPNGMLGDGLRLVAGHLTIFGNGGEAIVRQIGHNVRGSGTYILGRTDPRAIWYYFPLALTMKLSAGVALLLAWLCVARATILRVWPLRAAGILLAASVAFRVQSGIRLILPVFPLIIVAVSVGLSDLMRGVDPIKRRVAAAAAAASVLWTTAALAGLWPDTLRFTSELWGGTSRGHLLLSDSNYDWGQGLIELERWQRQDPRGAFVDLWYWGTDPRARTGPWRLRAMEQLPIAGPGDVERALAGRYLAASTTLIWGSELGADRRGLHDPRVTAMRVLRSTLTAMQPVARTTTYFIYDFTAAMRAGRVSQQVISAQAIHPQKNGASEPTHGP